MNYLVLHPQSSLIETVIASSTTPRDSAKHRFIPVSDAALSKYYRLAARLDHYVSVGALAAVSPSVLEALGGNAESLPSNKPQRSRKARAA